MKKLKKQKRQAYKQRPARRKAHKNTPRRNVSTIPFMGGQLIRVSGLTREEAEQMSTMYYNNHNIRSWTSSEKPLPTMVLWKQDFTDDNPFFRLAFDPRETKANMVHNIMGVDVQGIDEAPNAVGEITAPSGSVYCIGTWDAFVVAASEGQVKHVIDYLDEFFSPIIY